MARLIRLSDLPGWLGNAGGQADFLADQRSEVKAGQAGNRSGKTHAAVRDHLAKRLINRLPPSSVQPRAVFMPGLIVCPSYRDFTTTVWPSLLEAGDEAGLRPIYKRNDQVVIYPTLRSSYGPWGCAYSIIRSAEHPLGIKNFEVADYLFEEFGHITERPDDPGADPVTLTPTRMSLEAPINQGVYIGTPIDGPGNPMDRWFESCDAHPDRTLPREWAVYQWSTYENEANLAANYIARVRRAITSHQVESVIFGRTAATRGSRAYPDYDERNHDRALVYTPALPLLLTCDWNVEPMVWGLSQFTGKGYNHELRVIEEFVLETNGRVEPMARIALARIRELGHSGDLYVSGDPAGSARTITSHESGVAQLKRVMREALGDRVKMRIRKAASPQHDRLLATNLVICDSDGRRRMVVNPERAPWHDRDFMRVRTKPDGSLVKPTTGPGKLLTHASDGIAEWCYDVTPNYRAELKGASANPIPSARRRVS